MSEMQLVTEATPVRVWQMNDYEWIAARTLTDAVNCLMEFTSRRREEILADEPHALSDGDLARLTFMTEVEEDGIPGVYKRHAFAVELKRLIDAGVKFPHYFATTEI